MQFLVQIPTPNDDLPIADSNRVVPTNNQQSFGSNIDSNKNQDEEIKTEETEDDEELKTEEDNKGYESDSTDLSDNSDYWWPSDPHHYYFEITPEEFGIFIGEVNGKLQFVKNHQLEDGYTNYKLTVFQPYEDKYLVNNKNTWYLRYYLSDDVYNSLYPIEQAKFGSKCTFLIDLNQSDPYYTKGKVYYSIDDEGDYHPRYINAQYAANLSNEDKISLKYGKNQRFGTEYQHHRNLEYIPWPRAGETEDKN
jgi:hypothetical protein